MEKGTLTVKSSSLRRSADYVNEESDIRMNVNYNIDDTTMTLTRIDGDIYRETDSTYVGNFNGNISGDSIQYSISGVRLSDMGDVYNALGDVEQLIAENETPAEEGGDA